VFKPGVSFTGVRFENGYQYGINLSTSTLDEEDAVQISRCSFLNSGGSGIISTSSAVNIRQTLIQGSRGRGLSLFGLEDSGEISNVIVTACSTSALVMESSTNIPVTNSVFDGCGYHGIHLNNNCEPTIINTIVSRNGRYGILAENSSSPFIDYNNVWGNGIRLETPLDYQGSSASILAPGPGSLSSDPVFAGGGDYHLGGGSPCVDAGDPGAEYNDANGSRNDIGAFGGPGGSSVGSFKAPRPLAAK
jgi:parallel beta-helix repeat protein